MENQDSDQSKDSPVIDMQILRRDMYILTGLLLADKEVAKVGNIIEWAQVFYENEVTRLLLWVAVAVRGLLDLEVVEDDRKKKKEKENEKKKISKEYCGEYWSDTRPGKRKISLTFKQACNSIIHTREIVPYVVPSKELTKTSRHTYDDRATVRSENRGKKTRAHLDVVRFVQIADELINVIGRI